MALKLESRVKFFPKMPRKKLAEFYSKALVTVLPSWSEGFGLVVAEAMKCCSIVLGSNIPGISDQIEDGKTGFLFRARDSTDLAEKLDFIFSSKSLGKVRENALEKAKDFSLEKMVSSYKRIYRRLLHGKGI